jgi:excisionase family DNA binding protein
MIAGHFTIKEIIEKTGICRSVIYKLESKKRITFKRLVEGGKVYIKLTEIEEALK